MRLSFVLNSNNSTINLNSYERIRRAKLCKFVCNPDNLNTRMLCVQIDGLNGNHIVSQSSVSSYFFMIPFVNNTIVPIYSNDLRDTWDFESSNEVIINKFVIRITNESGQLVIFNNSIIVIELLIE